MKKYGVILILICLMFIVGCISGNYFKIPEEATTADEESELIKEIQEIEKQLGLLEEETGETDEIIEKDLEGEEGVIQISGEDEDITDEELEALVKEAQEKAAAEDTEKAAEDSLEEETAEEEPEIVEEIKEAAETTGLQRLEIQETELVNLQVETKDLDEDKVTYTFSKPLDANGKWQTNYGDNGDYIVTITANDGTTTSEKKVLLVVEKKNVPPKITGLQTTLDVDEGEVVTLSPKVSDPNKDDVEVTFPRPFNINGVWETDHTSAGDYDLTLRAFDGEMESIFSFKLTVHDVNVPPTISGLSEKMVMKEGEIIELKPEISDLDGDKVRVTISEPIGDDKTWETTYTDHGKYVVIITADDGKDKTNFNIELIVNDVNVPPEIIGVRLS